MSDDIKPISKCDDVKQVIVTLSAILQSERETHLASVDRLERALGISPRTAELRQIGKLAIKSAIDK